MQCLQLTNPASFHEAKMLPAAHDQGGNPEMAFIKVQPHVQDGCQLAALQTSPEDAVHTVESRC